MYLSGYRTEAYQLDLQQSFGLAQKRMESAICTEICSDIGGDHQRIHHHSTNYSNITFKHALLPKVNLRGLTVPEGITPHGADTLFEAFRTLGLYRKTQ